MIQTTTTVGQDKVKRQDGRSGTKPQDYRVRLAKAGDVEALIEMSKAVHAEGGVMPMSESRVRILADRAVKRDRFFCGVIGEVGKLEAVIALMIGQYWYSTTPHLEEIFAYVRPEFRSSARAKALLEFAKFMASDVGVPLIIGVLSNNRTEAKIRLYKRQLGEPAGCYFLYNGKTGN